MKRRDDVRNRLLDEHANIKCYLVIAGPCGVEPERRFANQLEQSTLDVHVNVFKLDPPGKAASLNLTLHQLQPCNNRLAVVASNDLLSGQHPGVGNRACDVLSVQSPVVVQRDGVVGDDLP